VIGDYAHICPNVALAGGVSIGSKSWIGIGSQVKQLITIGDNCLIGAGSTVVKNIPDNVTAFGSPAVVIKSH
uniref:DapH/DapD/GlmU-related protein n=1 Tax=Pseudoalteromonas nigrifaciens TaxID=28109 RepID=UPI0035685800